LENGVVNGILPEKVALPLTEAEVGQFILSAYFVTI
jgi:hypothetical protein